MNKALYLSACLFFVNAGILSAQKFFKNVEVSLATSTQLQDRRSSDLSTTKISGQNESPVDFEYLLQVQKVFSLKERFKLSAGLGYSLAQSTFTRPFDHTYFTGIPTEELRHVESYLIHSAFFSLAPELVFSKNGRNTFYINAPVLTKFAVNKHMKSGGAWKESKTKAEFNKLEAYAGIGFRAQRLGLNLAYRAFNLQKVDPVIFYDAYKADETNPRSLRKSELKNIAKIMLTLSYRL